VHLVSSAVEGLKAENVTVVDTAGELLSAQTDLADGSGSPMMAASQLKFRRDFEAETARSLESMLEKVLGPGRAVVRVSAKMNFDRKETEEETYQPAEGSQGSQGAAAGVLTNQEQVSETYAGGKPGASGVPGVASNTGPTAGPPKIAANSSDSYQRTENKTEYRVSRRVNRTTVEPGQVERMSVAVFVDGDPRPSQIAKIQETVTAAAGLDPSRGDQVIVQGAKFNTAPDQEAAQDRQLASRRTLITVGKDAAAVVLLLVFLMFARSAFKAKTASAPESVASQLVPEGRPVAGYAGVQTADAALGRAEAPLTQLSQAESETLARSIRAWLTEPKLETES
jgi:flagellar M-ring protein FliF